MSVEDSFVDLVFDWAAAHRVAYTREGNVVLYELFGKLFVVRASDMLSRIMWHGRDDSSPQMACAQQCARLNERFRRECIMRERGEDVELVPATPPFYVLQFRLAKSVEFYRYEIGTMRLRNGDLDAAYAEATRISTRCRETMREPVPGDGMDVEEFYCGVRYRANDRPARFEHAGPSLARVVRSVVEEVETKRS